MPPSLKKITLVVLTLGALLFLLSASPTFAQQTGPCQGTRALLPILPGSQGLDPCSSPAAYVVYWFYLSLYLAGIAALLILVFAGFTRLVSGFMPSAVSGANKMVTNAALGLILLFSGWLLLSTLNPKLLSIGNSSFPPLGGCTMGFLPFEVSANQPSTLNWSLFFENTSYGLLSCSQKKPPITAQKVSLYDTISYTSDVEGLHSCALTAFDSQDRGVGICRASLVVKPACNLTWSAGASGSGMGTLGWKISPTVGEMSIGFTSSAFSAPKVRCADNQDRQFCSYTPPPATGSLAGKGKSGSNATAYLNIKRPWSTRCELPVAFP